uniref:Uncharacterized protein n=1 Tax=Ditylenchus dipsaci TaxID=166011 RepID=A0A915DL86_9BILA
MFACGAVAIEHRHRCTSQGLFLQIRNALECSARSCSSTSKSNSSVSNNYMNANDVFSLPKISYADKSTQCGAVADVNPAFASSMFFHPYRLKPNRQIKCIQCSNTSSFVDSEGANHPDHSSKSLVLIYSV